MFRVSVPGKLVLFGEWAVAHGGAGLASALSCRLRLRVEEFGGSALEFVADSRREFVDSLESLPEGFFALAAGVVRELGGLRVWGGKRLVFESGWKLEEGLGSSSAVILALLLAHESLEACPTDPFSRWQRGRAILRKLQSPKASGIDLAAQTLGGQVMLQADDPLPLRLDIPPELRLLHTGEKWCTTTALRDRQPSSETLQGLGRSVIEFVRTRDWVSAMREHARLLEGFGVVPHEIVRVRQTWMSKDWVRALKTTGAGGGDALMVLVNPPAMPLLEMEARERGWWWSTHTLEGAPARREADA